MDYAALSVNATLSEILLLSMIWMSRYCCYNRPLCTEVRWRRLCVYFIIMGPNIQKFRAGAVTSESFIDNMMLTKPQHEFYNSIRTLSKMFIRLKPDELPKD